MTLLLDSYFLKPSGNVETRAILADAWKVTVTNDSHSRMLTVKVLHILGHRARLVSSACVARFARAILTNYIDNVPAA